MKYLKGIFEKYSDIRSDIEDISYILKDEGHNFKISDIPINAYNKSEFISYFINISPSANNEWHDLYGLEGEAFVKWMSNEYYPCYEEFLNRLKNICEEHGYYIYSGSGITIGSTKFNFGYEIRKDRKDKSLSRYKNVITSGMDMLVEDKSGDIKLLIRELRDIYYIIQDEGEYICGIRNNKGEPGFLYLLYLMPVEYLDGSYYPNGWIGEIKASKALLKKEYYNEFLDRVKDICEKYGYSVSLQTIPFGVNGAVCNNVGGVKVVPIGSPLRIMINKK